MSTRDPAALLVSYLERAEKAMSPAGVVELLATRYDLAEAGELEDAGMPGAELDELRGIAEAVHEDDALPRRHDVGTYRTCSRYTCQRLAAFLGDR